MGRRRLLASALAVAGVVVVTHCSSVPDLEFVDDELIDGSAGDSSASDGSGSGDGAASDAPDDSAGATCAPPEPAGANKCCGTVWCDGVCSTRRCEDCEKDCGGAGKKCCARFGSVTCKDLGDDC